MQVKTIEWATIIEYFTKLGRPLSKDEIKKLQDEDKRMQEEEDEQKRREEEAERRRMARLMDDFNPDGDAGQDNKARKRPNFNLEDEDADDYSERDDDKVFQGFDDEDEFDSDDDSDDLEREYRGTTRMSRTRSTKQFKGDNLNGQRVTADDYMHQVRSKSMRKGRYGVTVPQPFKFEIRDSKAKAPNTRERKVNEMVMEKKMETDNMVKHQFRHKPIPAAVLVPRYQQLMDANEERRLRVKQESIQITKEREAPFSFWERDKIKMAKKANAEAGLVEDCKRPAFKANRMPDFSSIRIYAEEMQIQEEARLKRIH